MIESMIVHCRYSIFIPGVFQRLMLKIWLFHFSVWNLSRLKLNTNLIPVQMFLGNGYRPEQVKHLSLHDWISLYLLQDALQWFHKGAPVLFLVNVVEVVKQESVWPPASNMHDYLDCKAPEQFRQPVSEHLHASSMWWPLCSCSSRQNTWESPTPGSIFQAYPSWKAGQFRMQCQTRLCA